ncbi:MAG: glycosyltransferase [Chloroflexi bacterium]|nr:glycosyltransferase [Chloroflexota bacterium]
MRIVSLIVTVKNEAAVIDGLLQSISAQTRLPDEVVISDGGSTDGTAQVVEAWGARQPFPVRVLAGPGANIAQGRNIAIRAAQGDLIASTDAGVRLAPRWLQELLVPFDESGQPPDTQHVVAGFFLPDAHTVFEVAMSAAVLPSLAEVDPQKFLPSSRSVAFTKKAWQTVGGYPESLDYCEDLVFDLALKRQFVFAFAPQAVAYFRPRGSLRAFFRQYYLYARGDGKADLWRRRHAIRYLTYCAVAPLLLALGMGQSPLWFIALGAGAVAYGFTPYRRLRSSLRRLKPTERLYALWLVPLIRVTGDIAKMAGYPVGVLWRLRHRARGSESGRFLPS